MGEIGVPGRARTPRPGHEQRRQVRRQPRSELAALPQLRQRGAKQRGGNPLPARPGQFAAQAAQRGPLGPPLPLPRLVGAGVGAVTYTRYCEQKGNSRASSSGANWQ